jgi:AcrR family transcriptional regulator
LDDKKADLLNCGKELFSSRGFKDTKVSDITKMANMAVGTFYKYYSSKEELFMEIYLKENFQLKQKIAESVDFNGDPAEIASKFFSLNISGMNSNPILKEWYNKELFSRLEKEFHSKGGIDSIHKYMNSGMIDMIRKWKSDGKIRDDFDDELILAIFNSIPYIDIHKEEIGIQHFPQILDYMIKFVMKGLAKK